jgi:hypothetical protein
VEFVALKSSRPAFHRGRTYPRHPGPRVVEGHRFSLHFFVFAEAAREWQRQSEDTWRKANPKDCALASRKDDSVGVGAIFFKNA